MSERTYPLIDPSANLLSFFRGELTRACAAINLQITQEVEAYLVHLLDGFVRLKPEHHDHLGFHRPAALLLGEAAHTGSDRRVEAYRQLGDTCLYNCGFFEGHLTRRGVRPEYYHAIGATAYTRLADWMAFRQPGGVLASIFGELARKFDVLTRALQGVAS